MLDEGRDRGNGRIVGEDRWFRNLPLPLRQRAGKWFRLGFAPRAQGMSIYLISDFEGEADLMKKVGRHKMGRSCMTFAECRIWMRMYLKN